MFSEKGWINCILFEAWLGNVLVPYHKKQISSGNLPADQPGLLLVDGHSSHESLAAIEMAKANNITIFCLPPHFTHLLQPLDVSYFRSLKSNWSREAETLGRDPRNEGKYVTKATFCRTLNKAWEKTIAKRETVTNGFRRCGLFPFRQVSLADLLQDRLPPSHALHREADDDVPQLDEAGDAGIQIVDEGTRVSSEVGQTVDRGTWVSNEVGQTVDRGTRVSNEVGQTVDRGTRLSNEMGQTVDGGTQVSNEVGQTVDRDTRVSNEMGQTVDGSRPVSREVGQIDDEGRVSNEGVHGDSDSLGDLLKLLALCAGLQAKGRVNVNKENKRVNSIKKTRCSVKKTKKEKRHAKLLTENTVKILGDDGASVTQATNVADASSEEDCDCIYCEESFIQTGGDWIECQSCKKWAQCKCAVIDSGERYFTCSLCE